MERHPRGTVDLVVSEDACRLHLAGEFDLDNSELILEVFLRALREPAPEIELDLSRVTLLSSAAVSSLLQAASVADERHRHLTIVAVSDVAERVIDVLGLARFFERS